MLFEKAPAHLRTGEYDIHDAPPAYTPVASSSYNPPVINTQQAYASNSRGSNVRCENNASRGPICSIISLAVTNVAKAVSHTNSPIRTTLGVVEGFVASRLDKREIKEIKREMKRERREVKREMKRERREDKREMRQERRALRKACRRPDNVIVLVPQYPTH